MEESSIDGQTSHAYFCLPLERTNYQIFVNPCNRAFTLENHTLPSPFLQNNFTKLQHFFQNQFFRKIFSLEIPKFSFKTLPSEGFFINFNYLRENLDKGQKKVSYNKINN